MYINLSSSFYPQFTNINKKSIKSNNHRILFVSQPEIEKNTFDSLFLTQYKQTNILSTLADIVRKSSSDFKMYYRPHSKENLNNLVNSSLILDNSSKFELLNKYDMLWYAGGVRVTNVTKEDLLHYKKNG